MSQHGTTARDGSVTPTDDRFQTLLEECWNMYAAERRRGSELELLLQQRDDALQTQKNLEGELTDTKRLLQVYREGYETKCKIIEDMEVRQQSRSDVPGEPQHSIIVCLLDGDGTIPAPEHLSEGQQGGRRVAQLLISNLLDYGANTGRPRTGVRVVVNLYLNRSGLKNTLVRNRLCTSQQYDAFWDGFQATGLFSVIDVGHSNQAADAKIRDSVDLYARIPQVSRIFLGVAHDGGYHSPLSALQLDGLIDKAVLLRGYDEEIARDLRKLELPEARFPGLFLQRRMETLPYRPLPLQSFPSSTEKQSESAISGPPMISSNLAEDAKPGCLPFYLRGKCILGDQCRCHHHREHSDAELSRLRIIALTVPCTVLTNGYPCPFGSNCPMSHKCRYLRDCHHFRKGCCKWSAPGMHDADPVPSPLAPTPTLDPQEQPASSVPATAPSSQRSASPSTSADKPIIVCLIDGHRSIFSFTHVSLGRPGGVKTGQLLEQSIREYAGQASTEAAVSVSVICDRQALQEAIPLASTCRPPKVAEFWDGFTENKDVFGVVDVGGEAGVTRRLCELLLPCARISQVTRVLLAIDGTLAYLAPLRVLCAEGHASKIALIRIQQEPLAPEMAALGLAEVRFKGGLWTRKKLSLPKSPGASPVTTAYPPSAAVDQVAERIEPVPAATTQSSVWETASNVATIAQAASATPPVTSTGAAEKPFIICLIDGCSLSFPPEMINQSRSGGLAWASRLERLLRGVEPFNASQAILTVTFVCDLNELKSSLLYTWDMSPALLDDFLEGFTEHASTFSIRNVKTAEAEQVLQELLITYMGLDQVQRVVLGVGGRQLSTYVAPLHKLQGSQPTNMSKIRTLCPDVDTPLELDIFDIAHMHVPGLFVTSTAFTPFATPMDATATFLSPDSVGNDTVFASATDLGSSGTTLSPSASFSSLLGPSFENETQMLASGTWSSTHRSTSSISSTTAGQPPCNFYFTLGHCALGDACPYDHSRSLTSAEVMRLRGAARSAPCIFVKKGKPCPYGEECCMRHRCPKGPDCAQFQAGKWCKFSADMHC